ncbi:MAG: DUF4012 domain-containing protein [Candidatus Kuenenbacteria bacterium]
MKLEIRKIKGEEKNKVLNEKPIHLVNLKIFENQKENQIKKREIKNEKISHSFLNYIAILQELIYKIKNFLKNLNLFKKICDEFSQSKKALFFYSKKFFTLRHVKFHYLKQGHKNILKVFLFIKRYISIWSARFVSFKTHNNGRNIKTHRNISHTSHVSHTSSASHVPLASHVFQQKKSQKEKFILFKKNNQNLKYLLSNIFSKGLIVLNNFYRIKIILFLTKFVNFIKNQYISAVSIICKKTTFEKHLRVPLKTILKKQKIKPILIFALIAFIFVLSLHILFLTQKSNGIAKEKTKKLNIAELTDNVNLSDFILNQSKFNQIVESLPANSKNRALLKAENYLSSAKEYLIIALNNKEIKKEIPTEQIINFQNNLSIALPKIQIANYYLTQVKFETIPEQNKNEFNQIKIYLSKLENNIQELLDYSKVLLQILGSTKKQCYLMVFQNDDKIRPTGGFIENFILIEIDKGIIKKIETQNITSLQKNSKNSIQSPYPLNLINPTWQIQDTNWFFDFPTSAQKILQFYQKTGESKKIDGVISLNASLIPKILKFTGPIEMSEYSTIINKENFLTIKKEFANLKINEEKNTQIDKNFDTALFDNQENITQNFIVDFIPKLLNKILSPQNSSEQSLKILEILDEALSKKDIMLYFNNPYLQKNILKNNWAGEIKSINNGDYLAIVNTNINGESDENIKQLVDLQTQILDDGTIINTVKITRVSFVDKENEFVNSKNLNYIKIYTPKGSTLLEIKGFKKNPIPSFKTSFEENLMDEDLLKIQKQTLIDEATNTKISQEFNKTVFGNWIEVDSEKSSTITFKYKLPFKLENLKSQEITRGIFQKFYKKIARKFDLINETLSYQLLIQKQSGNKDETWKYSINLPTNWRLVWQNFPIDFIEKDNQIEFNSFLDQDQLWLMLLKKIIN